MGIGYGLLRGLTADVIGAQEGTATRKQLERQAMHQALADSLLKAQIGEAQSLTGLHSAQTKAALAKPYTTEITDEEWAGFTADKPQLKGIPKAARLKVLEQWTGEQFKPEPDIVLPQGGTLISKRSGRVIAHGEPKAGKTTPPSVMQRQAAVKRLEQLHNELMAMEKANPRIAEVPWGSSIAEDVKKIPILGGTKTAQRIAQQQLSGPRAAYERKKQEYGSVYLQAVPAATRAIAMQELARGEFIPPVGTKEEAYPEFWNARAKSIATLKSGLGQEEGSEEPATSDTPKQYHPDNPFAPK